MVNLSNIPLSTRVFSTIPGWLFGISSINSIFDIFFGHFSSKKMVKHGTHENFDRSFDFGMKCIVAGYGENLDGHASRLFMENIRRESYE